jgi:integrase
MKAGLTRPCPFCKGKVTKGSAEKRCRQCEGKGIKPDFRFHDLRHQAATDLLSLGATLNDVRDFLRHKSVQMTLRYAHLVRDRRVKTAALLDALAPTTSRTPTAGTGSGQEKGVAKGATS